MSARALPKPSLFIAALLFAGTSLAPRTLLAQPANEPIDNFLVTDGVVNAMVVSGNILYVGGKFTQAGISAGGGTLVSTATALPRASAPVVKGVAGVAVPDGAGGWFAGGSFSQVGSTICSNLVHFRPDFSIDPGWHPATVGGVSAMYLSGGILYIGGVLTNVNGQARSRLAALDATTGAVTAWNPNANDQVSALFVQGTNCYCGGSFTVIGPSARSHIACVSTVSGVPTAWDPSASDIVYAFIAVSNRLFVGGYYTTIASQPRSRLASFDLATGVIDSWSPAMAGSTYGAPVVYGLANYGTNILVAGIFTSLGTSNRVNLGAVDMATGLATGWDAGNVFLSSSGFPSTYVQTVAVQSNVVYVGGPIAAMGGQTRWYAAAMDADTAAVLPWDPKANVNVTAICPLGTNIYLGGVFSALNCVTRTNLAAFDLNSRQITAWDPGMPSAGNANVEVDALAAAGNQIIVAGYYTNIGGVVRSNLAAVDATTGAVHPWTPNPNAQVMALATYGNRLIIGGFFSAFDGFSMPYFAEVDTSTFSTTFWNPTFSAFIRTLAVQSDTLYVGGSFSTVNGISHRRLVQFDLPSYSLKSWDGQITNGSYVDAIAPLGNRVYVGGFFNVVGGFNRTNFVVLDATTGAVLPMVANTDQAVYGVAANSNQVFILGNFSNVSGQKRNFLASLDANSNSLTPWNPNGDFYTKAAMIANSNLYVGGVFLRIGGVTTRSVAAYSLAPAAIPAFVPNTFKRLTNGSMEMRISAAGASQATVQGSTNLTTWQTVQPVSLVSGTATFTDNSATNYSRRFYRLSVP